MPYRGDVEALETRCVALERELADLEALTRDIADLRRREDETRRELHEARQALGAMRGKRALPLLEGLRIASPCKASWDDMVGDERVRFCGECAKNVYNVSAMPRDEAERLVRENEGGICIRMYKRADGTVMTMDCPVGARRKRRRRAAVAAVGGGLLAAAVATTTRATTMMGDVSPVVAMGGVQPIAPVKMDLNPPHPPTEETGHVMLGRPLPTHLQGAIAPRPR